jgi:uncharacterized phiE125 gp8 family phage protein
MGWQCATEATQEPVTLEEARTHCRVSSHDDDVYLASLISVARRWVERRTALQLVSATWTWNVDEFPLQTQPFYVPVMPVQSVTSVKYYDGDGTQQTLSSSAYAVDITSRPGRIGLPYGYSWPIAQDRQNAVEIIFKAGFGGAAPTVAQSVAAVPKTIKQAILLLVGHWYENREPVNIGNIVSDIPLCVESLLAMEEPGNYMPSC